MCDTFPKLYKPCCNTTYGTYWINRSSNYKRKTQVNDIKNLIHSVTHTYHPDITEHIPQTNLSLQDNNDSVPSLPPVFPSLPYTTENLKFTNKYKFQFSYLTDTEYITRCNLLLKNRTCSATRKNDVGKIATLFCIRLRPKAQRITQRPSKVPIHYRDKLNTLLEDLQNNLVFSTGQTSLWHNLYKSPSYNTKRKLHQMCIRRSTS